MNDSIPHVYQSLLGVKTGVNCQNIALILVFKGLELNQEYCQFVHHHYRPSSPLYNAVRVQRSHHQSEIEYHYDFSRYGVRYCTAIEYFVPKLLLIVNYY